MNYLFFICLLIIGLFIGMLIPIYLTNINIKMIYKIIIRFGYIGIYISFVSVFLSPALDVNFINTSKVSLFTQFIILIPIVSILFYNLNSFLESLKINQK